MNGFFKILSILTFIFFSSESSFSQSKVKIWNDIEQMETNKTKILVYPASPENNNGAAVIICPGGSYHHLGVSHEGKRTAEWFNENGVSAFVLCYRTSFDDFHHPAMIEDFQRSIQLVKENAEQYGIDTTRIGAIGFSAGGHLVTMGGAFGKTNYLKSLDIDTKVGLIPNWIAAIYPVVSMQDSVVHKKSRRNLIGKNHFTKEELDMFSMELQIHDDMPPMYIQASKDDDVVNYRNSVFLDKALTNKKINHKFVLFETGGHGYGMKDTEFAKTSKWQDILLQWLKEINVIQ